MAEATAGSASSGRGWLASSGHQQVALGTQWPFNSQKGNRRLCLGVIRARGRLWGPLPVTFPLEARCLGTLGQRARRPRMGFLWFQTLPGSCSVVSEQAPPGCAPPTHFE